MIFVCSVTNPFFSSLLVVGQMDGRRQNDGNAILLARVGFFKGCPLIRIEGAAPLLIEISSTMLMVAGVWLTVMIEGAAFSWILSWVIRKL